VFTSVEPSGDLFLWVALAVIAAVAVVAIAVLVRRRKASPAPKVPATPPEKEP
jgi:hypothetical protein